MEVLMIDRRVFLKSLAGAGIGLSPLPCFGAKKKEITQYEAFFNLLFPDVTLLVKVNEVAVYPGTREFDAIGECFVNFEKFPIEVRFFLTYTDLQSIQPGIIYIMTGELYLYSEVTGINMVSPEFRPARTVLLDHFLSEVEQQFNAP
jgi:hypothetical protein